MSYTQQLNQVECGLLAFGAFFGSSFLAVAQSSGAPVPLSLKFQTPPSNWQPHNHREMEIFRKIAPTAQDLPPCTCPKGSKGYIGKSNLTANRFGRVHVQEGQGASGRGEVLLCAKEIPRGATKKYSRNAFGHLMKPQALRSYAAALSHLNQEPNVEKSRWEKAHSKILMFIFFSFSVI